MTMLSTWLVARMLALLAASRSEPSPIPVVVDVSVADGHVLRAHLAAGLQPFAPLVSATPAAPVAFVRVTGELLDFDVGLALPPAREPAWSRCPCTHAELVTHVQQRVAHALRPRPAPPSSLPLRVHAAPPRACPPCIEIHPHGLGRPGRLGVVLVGLGSLALGTGTGLWLVASTAGDERWAIRSDLRPHILSSMVLGASVLTTGALLLFDRRPRPARLRAAHP